MSDAFRVAGAGADLCSVLRETAKNCLFGKTLALSQVECCRDEAWTDDDPIAISIFTPKISRTWLGDAPPQFQAKISLAIVGRVLGPTLAMAEMYTDLLRLQMENALLSAPSFWATPLERVNSIETTIEFPGKDAMHEGQVTMVLECQCVDIFVPIETTSFETVNLSVPNPTVPASAEPESNLIGVEITIPGAIPQGD